MIINTKEDWWNVFDNNIDDILEFITAIGINISSKIWYDGTEMDHSILMEIKQIRDSKDISRMHSVVNRIWGHAPDASWIHSYRGFYIICDLCSEVQPEFFEG